MKDITITFSLMAVRRVLNMTLKAQTKSSLKQFGLFNKSILVQYSSK